MLVASGCGSLFAWSLWAVGLDWLSVERRAMLGWLVPAYQRWNSVG
jgi:hypothetical protein